MSGLEKFQASEAWRTNIKKFLFMERNRNPVLLQQTTTISETQRYSLDIGEDLKNILEQKKNLKTVKFNLNKTNTSNRNNITSENDKEKQTSSNIVDDKEEMNRQAVFNCNDTSIENFEAIEKICDKTASDPNSTLFQYFDGKDKQIDCRNVTSWQKTLDESFEALEKMCDKTASDPNSTLFHYLHSENKEQILADVKKRSADGNAMAQGRSNDPLLLKLNNCTLLDDIEEPSRMWENTICSETILQTSPVKMVGLLRPSTIIEEAPDDSTNSDVSSQMSFQTATTGVPSYVSSSAYDTAHDSTVASTGTDNTNKREYNQLEVIDVDNILLSAFAKSNAKDAPVPSTKIIETTTSTSDSYENKSSDIDMSLNLIDLEKTFSPLNNSPHSSLLEDTLADVEVFEEDENNEITTLKEKVEETDHNSYNIFDESIIEILSDEEEIEDNEKQHGKAEDLMLFTEIKTEANSKNSNTINHDTYSFNESSSYEENKENFEKSSDKSMQFNDTMEEVEYMLKKGMEYMAAEAAAREFPHEAKIKNSEISTTQPNSPMVKNNLNLNVNSASKVKSLNYITPTKKTLSTKCEVSSSKKRYGNDIIKPFPKFDIFAKPTHARHKELTSKQQKFSHIVSPIGTYVKKTGTTPLMSSLRNKNKNSDLLNSTAFRELENESRLYHPKFGSNSNANGSAGLLKLPGLSGSPKTLPKKAYISSELKHIVDERTPVTIPGGKKIQKYLENAMMPAVLRHDGKLKIPGGINNKLNTSTSSTDSSKLPLKPSKSSSAASAGSIPTSHIPRRNNASLADLSLMSGDVSMYTIMDAQKF